MADPDVTGPCVVVCSPPRFPAPRHLSLPDLRNPADEREAAWAAVKRQSARLHPGGPALDESDAWWREGANRG